MQNVDSMSLLSGWAKHRKLSLHVHHGAVTSSSGARRCAHAAETQTLLSAQRNTPYHVRVESSRVRRRADDAALRLQVIRPQNVRPLPPRQPHMILSTEQRAQLQGRRQIGLSCGKGPRRKGCPPSFLPALSVGTPPMKKGAIVSHRRIGSDRAGHRLLGGHGKRFERGCQRHASLPRELPHDGDQPADTW